MSSIKINWGVGIAFLYIGFVVLIIFLVTGSMRQDIDLVADDYYEQELKYQQVLDAAKNQSALKKPVQIYADEANVIVSFPEEFSNKTIQGHIHFYSPQQSAWDKKVALNNVRGAVLIPRTELQKAGYKIKLSWAVDGKNYYQESNISLL